MIIYVLQGLFASIKHARGKEKSNSPPVTPFLNGMDPLWTSDMWNSKIFTSMNFWWQWLIRCTKLKNQVMGNLENQLSTPPQDSRDKLQRYNRHSCYFTDVEKVLESFRCPTCKTIYGIKLELKQCLPQSGELFEKM